MTRIIDAEDFLVDGDLPRDDSPVRRNALVVARIVEYGGPLERRSVRETLLECRRRPGRKPCGSLIWVRKTEEDRIEAFCPKCDALLYLISNWKETLWANGPMEPLGPPKALS